MNKKLKYLSIIAVSMLLYACGGSETKVESSAPSVPSIGQSGVQDSESKANIVQVAVGSADHSTLVAALKAADYVDALTNVGPFTVFAPTNAAFDELPAGTLDNLVKKENQRTLRDILEYHVLLGVYKPGDFVDGRKMGTADGRPVTIEVKNNGDIFINNAKIIGTVETSNGIIHVLDKVLLPE